MTEQSPEKHALFGDRSAYEAKHALKSQLEQTRSHPEQAGNLHDVHNKLLDATRKNVARLSLESNQLNTRLIKLGGDWDKLVNSSGNDLNQKISAYIDSWAEIDRIFRQLEESAEKGTDAKQNAPVKLRESKEIGTENAGEVLLKSFESFLEKHGALIEQQVKQGKKLERAIYDSFYSEDIDKQLYKDGNPQFEGMRKTYENETKRILEGFLKYSKNYENDAEPAIAPGPKSIEKGWVYFKVNGGVKPGAKIGRLYLNIKPDQLPAFYERTLPNLQKNKLRVDSKISQAAKAEDVNRYDKMVIYFDESDQAGVMSVIEAAHKQNATIFMDGAPKSTTQLKDSQGKEMVGVSFGEEPGKKANGLSFGDVRSEILAEVYREAKKNRYPLSDNRSKITMLKACEKYGVNPNNPAFNAGEDSFGVVRSKAV